MVDFYGESCYLIALADFWTLSPQPCIESLSKGEHSRILNLIIFVDADNMVRTCLQEHSRCEFWVARSHEYKIKLNVFLAFDDLFQVGSIDILPFAELVFKDQSIALFIYFWDLDVTHQRLMLLFFIFSLDFFFGHPVPWKVDGTRFFCLQHRAEIMNGAVHFVHCDFDICLLYRLYYHVELFRVRELC